METTRTIDLNKDIAPAYQAALTNESRWLVLYGGGDSGKSWFAAQKTLIRCMQEPGHTFLVTRKVAKSSRDSTWQQLKDVLEYWGLTNAFAMRETDMRMRCIATGSRIVCAGLDDVEKLKSFANMTGGWHEEATEDMPKDLTQLNIRMRGKTPSYKQHIVTFNPISSRHPLRKRFCTAPIPDNVTLIHTTYRDNPFAEAEDAAELQSLTGNDRTVYRDGEWGVLEGCIYDPFVMQTVAEWPESFGDNCHGLDFGYNHPMAFVTIGLRDGEPWLHERLYETGLTTGDLIAWMGRAGINKRTIIWADSAEPDRIEEIRRAGYKIQPARKGQGSVGAGISFLQSLTIHTRPDNENLNAEVESYRWRVDRDDHRMEEPEKENDHLLDAARYALTSHMKRSQMPRKPLTRKMIGV